MATLTVRTPSKRDWLDIRRVRQRKISLAAPWDSRVRRNGGSTGIAGALTGLISNRNLLVALVDDELCGVAVFDRDDENFRWNLFSLAAGSPRVDATDEVAYELWFALLEEGIREAGRAGARRIFAFAEPDGFANDSLTAAGFSPYSRYSVIQGQFRRELREDVPIREQHESDLWSIHQLYNHTTPRPVQFAEAFTSDAWSTDAASHIPFRGRKRLGVVVPGEDGIRAACHIEMGGDRPVITLLCDDHLAHAIPSIVADSLELASIQDAVDIVLAGYQQHLVSPFVSCGFIVGEEVIGMVRHTTATVAKRFVTSEALSVGDVRPAVSVPYRGLSLVTHAADIREGA